MEENYRIIQSAKAKGVTCQVIEFSSLSGAKTLNSAMQLYFAEQAGMRLKMVKIILNGGSVKTEAGALYYMNGKIIADAQTGGVVGLLGKAIKSSVNKEATIKPIYTGEGEVYLEPTFEHYIVLELNKESIIVDKGIFYCCEGSIAIEPSIQKNVSSAMFGGEGIFQTRISGTGFVVLAIPVPVTELQEIKITPGNTLKIDGNFAIARTEGVTFTVTTSDKSIFGSMVNGEGLLQTFTGEGKVWIAPSAPVYRKLAIGMEELSHKNKSSNNLQ